MIIRKLEEEAEQQSSIMQELQDHIRHLEHLLEIEASSRSKALAKHKVSHLTPLLARACGVMQAHCTLHLAHRRLCTRRYFVHTWQWSKPYEGGVIAGD